MNRNTHFLPFTKFPAKNSVGSFGSHYDVHNTVQFKILRMRIWKYSIFFSFCIHPFFNSCEYKTLNKACSKSALGFCSWRERDLYGSFNFNWILTQVAQFNIPQFLTLFFEEISSKCELIFRTTLLYCEKEDHQFSWQNVCFSHAYQRVSTHTFYFLIVKS